VTEVTSRTTKVLVSTSHCRRTLRGVSHSAAGWGIVGSVMAADCGVQRPLIRAMGCHYLHCATWCHCRSVRHFAV